MNIYNLRRGLEILEPYCIEMDMIVKPNSFGNGAPDHSHYCYLSVEVDFRNPVPFEGTSELRLIGWNYEDTGTDYWLFKNW